MSLAKTIHHNDECPEIYKYNIYSPVILHNLESTTLKTKVLLCCSSIVCVVSSLFLKYRLYPSYMFRPIFSIRTFEMSSCRTCIYNDCVIPFLLWQSLYIQNINDIIHDKQLYSISSTTLWCVKHHTFMAHRNIFEWHPLSLCFPNVAGLLFFWYVLHSVFTGVLSRVKYSNFCFISESLYTLYTLLRVILTISSDYILTWLYNNCTIWAIKCGLIISITLLLVPSLTCPQANPLNHILKVQFRKNIGHPTRYPTVSCPNTLQQDMEEESQHMFEIFALLSKQLQWSC